MALILPTVCNNLVAVTFFATKLG